MGWFRRSRRADAALVGEARVLALGPTARGARRTGARDVEHAIRLAVHVEGQDPYEIDCIAIVPHAKTPLIGDRLTVRIATGDPADVRIDWSAAPDLAARSLAAGAAARRGDDVGVADALGLDHPDR